MNRILILAITLSVAALAEDITPRVGTIEIFGAHKVPLKKIKSALGIEEGDLVPPSRNDVEERVNKVSGIIASRIEAVCCDNRKLILYVGVEERDVPHFAFRTIPGGSPALQAELVDNYHAFLDAVALSMAKHHADEDLTNGYSLMSDPEARERQQYFLTYASENLTTLDQVIRQSADPDQRAMAAYILQYAPRGLHTTKTMVDALQYALLDAEDMVRDNAMVSLKAVAVGAKLHREQAIRIEPTWFVELMNSVVWSDRHDAALALVNLTENRDPQTLALLRDRALGSVVEMARWRDLEHALPAFILAGRLAGFNEQQIHEAWTAGDHEPVLEKALYPNGKRSILGAATSILHKQPKSADDSN